MPKLKFIKNTPTHKIGQEVIIKNEEGAKMYVEEGICEYVVQLSKVPKNKFEVEIVVPIINSHKKGDKRWMKKEEAVKYEKEGLVKILDKKTKEIIKFNNPINDKGNPLKQIVDRMKEKTPAFIEIFAGDDQKIKKEIKIKIFDVHKTSLEDIQKQITIFNSDTYGVFLNFNPLKLSRRLKSNIDNINYIFIDLDDAVEEHNEIIRETLKKYNITYSYNAKSGHGYHFLVPINISPDSELNVKAFLTYLKENICDKVDVATHTNERLFRAPGSLHNKDEESKQLMTLHTHTPTLEEIKNNNKEFIKYQIEQKKGKKDLVYQASIKKQDIFFTSILNDKSQWLEYIEDLNQSSMRNDNFIKNLGFFCVKNEFNYELAKVFLSKWEPARIAALDGWIKKGDKYNTPVLYGELLKWAKDNKLKTFIELLQKQTACSFLDTYEVYYLEDEKKESAYLLYYPEKNYFVQKSLPEVLQTIYYDARESGIDLIKELSLDLLEDWEDFSFKKQQGLIISCIHKKLEEENRIKLVFNINYEPTDCKFIDFKKKKFFNTYNKTTYWDYNKIEKSYGFPHIKELLMNLVGEDEKSYDYFNMWLGWIIQKPTEKLPTAIILQGRQGSGKGRFKSLILDNIFAENCQEINQTHLESSFNEYLLGKQIIMANEVMHNENRQTLPNVLKNLVTDDTITISRKFRKEIVGRNFTHWIFCTNSDNPIKIDQDDRRYSVFYSEKLKGGGKNAAKFIQSLMKNLEQELKQYISYLKSLKIKYEDVHEPIMTQAKEEIIDLNKDTIIKFIENLPRYTDLEDMFINIFGTTNPANFIGDGDTTLDTDSLYKAYVEWCHKSEYKGIFQKQNFSKKLSQLGIISFPRKFKEHPDNPKWISVRVYGRENIEKFMEVTE